VRSGSVCCWLSTKLVRESNTTYMINVLMAIGENAALIHQLELRMTQLKVLCVTWQAKIRAIPCAYDVGSSWGPSDDMLVDIAVAEVTGSWDTQDCSLPGANLQDAMDSDVSDCVDEDCDDLLDGQDLDDSDGSDDMLVAPSADLVLIHSPKRVRI
jgi:hypothetical protein